MELDRILAITGRLLNGFEIVCRYEILVVRAESLTGQRSVIR